LYTDERVALQNSIAESVVFGQRHRKLPSFSKIEEKVMLESQENVFLGLQARGNGLSVCVEERNVAGVGR
jgi:hypothetical protein